MSYSVAVAPTGKKFQVWLQVAQQSFPIGPSFDTVGEAEWYSKQFQQALWRVKTRQ